MAASPSILIVEDDAGSREGLRDFFRGNGYAVETCGDGLQGFRLVRSLPFDIALVDLDLPAVLGVPISGWDFIRMSRAYLPDLPVVVLTAQEHTRKLHEHAAALRVTDVLQKPVSPRRLKTIISALALRDAGARQPVGPKTSRGVCRMAIKKILALMIVVVLLTTGCAGLSAREKGALVGGSGGAAAGALFGAAAGNAALGAIIGGPVGLLGGYFLGPKLFKNDAGRH